MHLTIMIPVFNYLRFAMPMFGCLKYNTSEETEWLIIDNNSAEPFGDYIRKYIKPKRLNYIRNEANIGLVKNNQQAYEACETELLMLLHSDCFIFEKNWDQRIISYFKEMPDLGMAGFFGAQGCLPNGGRLQDTDPGQMAGLSNMLEAEIHGVRMPEDMPWRACAIYDSFAMVYRMEMLKKGKGFDTQYEYHHMYDRDSSLESLRRGYKNIVVNVPNHHIGGLTHEHESYEKWLESVIGRKHEDGQLHNENTERFIKKWSKLNALPLYVNDDFSFRTGSVQIGDQVMEYKGDAIRRA